MVEEIVDRCGSLFPFITNEKRAVRYAKELKSDFPFVVFELMEGSQFGDMKLVGSF